MAARYNTYFDFSLLPHYMELMMATLVINRSESYCLRCVKGDGFRYADPREKGHFTALGWLDEYRGRSGCGEPWTAVTSDYCGESFDNIEEHYFGFENLRGLPVVRRLDV